MATEVEPRTGRSNEQEQDRSVVPYCALAGVAAVTSVGIWLLMVGDEGRSVGGATLEMAVKFTNLTVLFVGVTAVWIAFGRAGVLRSVAHLTAMVMAVVTAVVNATLLDPALPGGWWGVVDLFQHYLVPAAVVVLWATHGPRLDVPVSRLGAILVVPLAWFTFVLVRGTATGEYPYAFVDVSANGWPSVAAMVVAIVVVGLALGTAALTIDRRRTPRPPSDPANA